MAPPPSPPAAEPDPQPLEPQRTRSSSYRLSRRSTAERINAILEVRAVLCCAVEFWAATPCFSPPFNLNAQRPDLIILLGCPPTLPPDILHLVSFLTPRRAPRVPQRSPGRYCRTQTLRPFKSTITIAAGARGKGGVLLTSAFVPADRPRTSRTSQHLKPARTLDA